MKKARIEKWVSEKGFCFAIRDLETFEAIDTLRTSKEAKLLAKQYGYKLEQKIVSVF